MARKPGIHGHKQLLPHKSWYNYPNHLSIKLTQNNKEALSNDNNRLQGNKKQTYLWESFFRYIFASHGSI